MNIQTIVPRRDSSEEGASTSSYGDSSDSSSDSSVTPKESLDEIAEAENRIVGETRLVRCWQYIVFVLMVLSIVMYWPTMYQSLAKEKAMSMEHSVRLILMVLVHVAVNRF